MKLYLVRHGNALGGVDDFVRPLSHEGIDEVKKVAEFLKEHNSHVDVIYHSVRLRARQTAEIIHNRLKVKKLLLERSGLSPDDPVEEIADFVDRQKSDCMIVGHMPFLGRLVSLLVADEENRSLVSFPTGGVVILEKKSSHPWLIVCMIDPKIL